MAPPRRAQVKLVECRRGRVEGRTQEPAMLPENHPRLFKRLYSPGELIADAFVHAAAIIAGAIAFSVMFVRIDILARPSDAAAAAIYAASFFMLFGFSCAYNMTPPSSLKWLLRRFDHASIYLLIAGTYTAALSQMADRVWAWSLIGIVWAAAIFGVVLKLALPGRYDRASILLYLAMGWVGVVAVKPLLAALPGPTLILIVVGGLLYTVGVAFYRWQSLKFQNAIWHAFVAVAAGCQYAGIAYAMARPGV
jgi:hemolysin III